MPCVTVTADAAAALQAQAEADPSTAFVIDLRSMTIESPRGTVALAMPAAAREAFLDGSWDATGLLLDRYDEVRAVADRLPYISGWR
jgi:3-isopropylmalate dehydratase small subunit